MKKHPRFLLLAAGALSTATFPAIGQMDDSLRARPEATAQTTPSGILSVVAGNGYFGGAGIPGPALDAGLSLPEGVVTDAKGDLYISDPLNSVVYKVTAGKIALYAGTGQAGYSGDGGAATKAKLDAPYGLALDSSGNLYIADRRNNRIREVNAKTGKISTYAGTGAGAGPGAQDECPLPFDGVAATKSPLCAPVGLAMDSSNNLYIADSQNSEIRMVAAKTGLVSTVAGSYGRVGYAGDGALAVNASLHGPQGVAVDAKDNIFIADTGNCAIREVTASNGNIESVLGSSSQGCTGSVSSSGTPASSASIGKPHSIAVDSSGNIYATDSQFALAYLIDSTMQNFWVIAGIDYPSSNLYATLDPEITLASGPGAYTYIDQAGGLTVDNSKSSPTYGDVLFADGLDGVVYKIAQPGVPQSNLPAISPSFPTQTTGSISVTITAPVAGSKIYYTINGKIPTTGSTLYKGPIPVKASAVITAFAVKSGTPNSQCSINVVLANPAPVFSATTVSGLNGTTPVTMTVPASGGKIYYTTDGTDPRAMGPTVQVYSKTITAHYRETLQAAYLPAPVTDFAGNVWQQWSPVTIATFPIELP